MNEHAPHREPPDGAGHSRRAAPLRARLALLAVSSLFGLLVLEVAARLYYARDREYLDTLQKYEHSLEKKNITLIDMIRPSDDPRLVYELLPGQRGVWKRYVDAPIRISAQGLRDREFPPEPDPGVFRIAALGDSMTFGQGVRADQTWPKILEGMLNLLAGETSGDGRVKPYEVINFGVPGYNTVMEAEDFRTRVLRYEPNAAVLLFFENDFDLPNFVRLRPNLWSPFRIFALQFVREQVAARLGKTGDMKSRGDLLAVPYVEAEDRFVYDPESVPEGFEYLVGPENAADALDRLKRDAEDAGVPVVLALAPDTFEPLQKTATSIDHPVYAWAIQQAGALDVPVADPAPDVIDFMSRHGQTSDDLSVTDVDRHPNPARHTLIAKAVFRVLVGNAVLPDAPIWKERLPELLERFDRRAAEALEGWNATPLNLVVRFYNRILGRDPEPGALDAWRRGCFEYARDARVAVRIAVWDMARTFFESPEYAERQRSDVEFLHDAWQALLGRSPQDSEVTALQAGSFSRRRVLADLLENPEFIHRMRTLYPDLAGEPARNLAATAYVSLFNRKPDSGGLEHFARLIGGAPDKPAAVAAMVRDLAASGEFQRETGDAAGMAEALWRALIGRAPEAAEAAQWAGMDALALIERLIARPEFARRVARFFEPPS